ncbi:hypothetical protein MRB53_039894 [Persea americana]|nr:hypothetical protein MRB53_039894 [Persea americana]
MLRSRWSNAHVLSVVNASMHHYLLLATALGFSAEFEPPSVQDSSRTPIASLQRGILDSEDILAPAASTASHNGLRSCMRHTSFSLRVDASCRGAQWLSQMTFGEIRKPLRVVKGGRCPDRARQDPSIYTRHQLQATERSQNVHVSTAINVVCHNLERHGRSILPSWSFPSLPGCEIVLLLRRVLLHDECLFHTRAACHESSVTMREAI